MAQPKLIESALDDLARLRLRGNGRINDMNRLCSTISLIITISFFAACGGSSDSKSASEPDPQARGYALGFTPWPYDASSEAVNFVYAEIISRGDIIAHHLDGGIPWQEALDGAAWPAAVEEELNTRVANTPSDKLVYLAVSPFNTARDNLAGYWNDSGTGQSLSAPWDGRDFDSEEVIQAYINFSNDAIDRFNPDYFNLALEASELALNDAVRFEKFIVFVQQVSESLRADYPNLKLMLSVAMKSPDSDNANIINTQVSKIVQYVDVVGVSIYPYVFFDHADKGDPDNLPENWLSQIQAVAAGKPLAVTETGWIAERLTVPAFSVDVVADEMDQDAYLRVLFDEAGELNVEFIVWFSIVDYDALWNGVLGQDDVARIWRDTGLYDESLNPRVALARWQQQLDIELAE